MQTAGEAAQEYARRGLAVLPLHTPVLLGAEWRCSCDRWPCPDQIGKHPRPGWGLKSATTDAGKVAEAWKKWPDANVGVRVPDGFFVVDLDGPEAIEWWEERGGLPTRTTLSGSGIGQHRWYRLPEPNGSGPAVVRNRTLVKLGDKVHREVKVIAAGMGYVVAPPSVWAKTGSPEGGGRRYGWLEGGQSAAVAPLPLLALIGASDSLAGLQKNEGNAGEMMREAAGMVEGSGRDSLMLRYLGSLHRFSPGEEALRLAAEAMNRAFADPLDERMVEQHVATIMSKPAGDLRQMAQVARLEGGGNGSSPNGDGPSDDGIPFRLQVERTNPKTWLLHFPTGVVRLSSPSLRNWGRIETEHIEQIESAPPWVPTARDPWPEVLDRLLTDIADEDRLDPPPELTFRGEAMASLARYAGEPPSDPSDPSASVERALEGSSWWDLDEGLFCFKFRAFCSWYGKTSSAERLTKAQLKFGIEAAGGEISVLRRLGPDKAVCRLSTIEISELTAG